MIVALTFLLQVGAAHPAPPPALAVRSSSAEAMVPLVETNAGPAVPIQALHPVIPVRLMNAQRGHFVIALPGAEIIVRDQVPFVTVNGTVHQLASAPFVEGGRLHVPFQLLADVLPRVNASQMRYDPRRGELRFLGASAPTTASAPRAPPSAGAARSGGRRVFRVVVDAGHGGRQTGMVGSLGPGRPVREKDITLAVSLEVERLLRQRGAEVIMIRRTDVDIDYRERGRIANDARGDLFISIHVNAANPRWPSASSARGFETYFLAAARSEDERRIAEIENAAAGFDPGAEYEADDPLGFLMRDMAQNAYLRESRDLAHTIQQHLAKTHPGPNRGVKQAPFAVLVRAFMPSVLVEIGFGSNLAEARYMASDVGRRQIATAIADATLEYLEHYERRLGTASQ
jgi:N-acetylmuramoyl-L-alanine amidase